MSADQLGRLCNSSEDFQVLVFSAELHSGNSKPKRKRSKLSNEKRDKVTSVRRLHACLRCRLLKVPCDGESPCSRCLALVSLANERKVLSFSECIRSRIPDINIYSDGFELNFSAAEPTVQELHSAGNVHVEFSTDVVDPTQLSSILTMVRNWISDAKNPQQMTLVDTLCSPSVKPVISDALGPEVADAFHNMLLATPLAHGYYLLSDTTKTDTMQVMWRNGHSAAFSVLERLGRLLTPAGLSQLSSTTGQALFILVFGALVVVDYASGVVQPTLSPPEAEKLNFSTPTNLWEVMRQHLRQVLAHYLVFLVDRLGQRFDPDLERRFLRRGIHSFNDNKIRILWTNHARIRESEAARHLVLRYRGGGVEQDSSRDRVGKSGMRAQTLHVPPVSEERGQPQDIGSPGPSLDDSIVDYTSENRYYGPPFYGSEYRGMRVDPGIFINDQGDDDDTMSG